MILKRQQKYNPNLITISQRKQIIFYGPNEQSISGKVSRIIDNQGLLQLDPNYRVSIWILHYK